MENKLIYENNIVEINKVYTNALIKILSPLLFEGLVSIYKRSKDLFSENENDKITLEDIFKICLKDVSNLNNYILTKELERIKEATKSSGYFDNLLKSVVKSYIILLTYNLSKKECILIEEKEHEKVDSVKFIHICYIELARNIFRNPKSFIDYIEENNINDEDFDDEYNGKYINMIENAIQKAIYKILPFEKIVNDYLKSDYVKKIDNDEEKKLQDDLVNKITNNILEKVILKQHLLNKDINYLNEPNKLTEQFSDYKENKQNDSYLQEYRNILLNGGNDDTNNDKELNKVEEIQINQNDTFEQNNIEQKDNEEDKLLKQVLNIGSNNQSNQINNNQSNQINNNQSQINNQSLNNTQQQINNNQSLNNQHQINNQSLNNQQQINNQSLNNQQQINNQSLNNQQQINNQSLNNQSQINQTQINNNQSLNDTQQQNNKSSLDEQIENEINKHKQYLNQQSQIQQTNQQQHTNQNFSDNI